MIHKNSSSANHSAKASTQKTLLIEFNEQKNLCLAFGNYEKQEN